MTEIFKDPIEASNAILRRLIETQDAFRALVVLLRDYGNRNARANTGAIVALSEQVMYHAAHLRSAALQMTELEQP